MKAHAVSDIITLTVMRDYRQALSMPDIPCPDVDYQVFVHTLDEGVTGQCDHRTGQIVVSPISRAMHNTLVHELTHSFQAHSGLRFDLAYDDRPNEIEAWNVAALANIRLKYGTDAYLKILSVKHWLKSARYVLLALESNDTDLFQGGGRKFRHFVKKLI